jgi:carbon monoxide dehydrogenase subunit G
MEFTGEFSVSSSPETVWEFILDPDELGNIIPNCQQVVAVDDTHYTAEVGVSVSHISVTFDANVEIVEQAELEYMRADISGNAKSGDSKMDAVGEFWMEPRDDGGTDIEYTVTLDVTGRVMNMGSRIVKSVGKRQTNKAIGNMTAELGEV